MIKSLMKGRVKLTVPWPVACMIWLSSSRLRYIEI